MEKPEQQDPGLGGDPRRSQHPRQAVPSGMELLLLLLQVLLERAPAENVVCQGPTQHLSPHPLCAGGRGSRGCFQPRFSWRGMQPHVGTPSVPSGAAAGPAAIPEGLGQGSRGGERPTGVQPSCCPDATAPGHRWAGAGPRVPFCSPPVVPAGPRGTTSPLRFRPRRWGAGRSDLASRVRPLPPRQQSLQESLPLPPERRLPVSRSLDLCIPYTFEIVELIAGSCWNTARQIPLPFFLNSIVSGAPGASSTPCKSWWKASSGLASMGFGAG